jgi:hypothetical protein
VAVISKAVTHKTSLWDEAERTQLSGIAWIANVFFALPGKTNNPTKGMM